ncbi:MAG: radical SAM protein [Gammaproteobacteria bacterium]|nr:radical SAM protein [Gammaproteobacteria bacterium]MBU1416722.1 radical SAM protein [Gammaproteobacteria bacterium]
MLPQSGRLTVEDHSRNSAGMTYVYPVVSRRAGGISVGINLNPNSACNWRCIYCQVPNLVRGRPPPIDLAQLRAELDEMLDAVVVGDFLETRVPDGQRRLIDVAFSGNGEPTSAAEFPQAVEIVVGILRQRNLLPGVKLRLITNGSLIDRRGVREGIAAIGAGGGEVWFKVDAANSAAIARINGSRTKTGSVERRLRLCGELCPTWVQTCLFALDGQLPSEAEIAALVDFLGRCRDSIHGVHLYGLARPSAQPEAGRLSRAPASWLDAVAAYLRQEGLTTKVNP